MFVPNAIVSASHNNHRTREHNLEYVLNKAHKEICDFERGRTRGISHIILRSADDSIDNNKFLFPYGARNVNEGIPLFLFGLANVINTPGLESIVLIGSGEVCAVADEFLDMANPGVSVSVIHESGLTKAEAAENLSHPEFYRNGPRLSLGHSIGLALDQLGRSEPLLFYPLDVPFFSRIHELAADPRIERHSVVVDLNCRENMFPLYRKEACTEFDPRNYHFVIKWQGLKRKLHCKEAQAYVFRPDVFKDYLYDLLQSNRKGGGALKALLDYAFKESAGLRKRPVDAVSFLANSLPLALLDLPWNALQYVLKKLGFSTSCKAANVNFVEGAASALVGDKIWIGARHADPFRVCDIDAWENYFDHFAWFEYAAVSQGVEDPLSIIHPHGDILARFRDEKMPHLRQDIGLYSEGFTRYAGCGIETLQRAYREMFGRESTLHNPFRADGTFNLDPANPGYRAAAEALRKNMELTLSSCGYDAVSRVKDMA